MANNESRPPDTMKPASEGGFALLTVLGFLLVLSALLLPFASSARIRALAARNHLDEVQYGLALGAVNSLAAKRLAETQPDGRNRKSGKAPLRPMQAHCLLDHGTLDIQIQEHSGLIDLNAANLQLLMLGLTAAGLDSAMASSLAQGIDQYRRRDGDRNLIVASLTGREGLKYAPFEDVTELYDFPALRSLALSELMRIFTVHSKSSVVSSSTLSPTIKAALSEFPEASKGLMATATLGSDVFTIESIFRTGSTSYYEAGIYRTGSKDIGTVTLLNSLPFYTGMQRTSDMTADDCTQILGDAALAVLQKVF